MTTPTPATVTPLDPMTALFRDEQFMYARAALLSAIADAPLYEEGSSTALDEASDVACLPVADMLKDDATPMPVSACRCLGLPDGSSYAEGVACFSGDEECNW